MGSQCGRRTCGQADWPGDAARAAVLEISDEGGGITQEEQKKIFEPFYSSKNSNTSWGMGLYHVRTIVRAHVGSLRVESQPGKGTSFFVLLPKYVQGR